MVWCGVVWCGVVWLPRIYMARMVKKFYTLLSNGHGGRLRFFLQLLMLIVSPTRFESKLGSDGASTPLLVRNACINPG